MVNAYILYKVLAEKRVTDESPHIQTAADSVPIRSSVTPRAAPEFLRALSDSNPYHRRVQRGGTV